MAAPALGFTFSWETHEPWNVLATPPGGGRNMAGVVRDAEGGLFVLGGSDEHGVPLSTVARWAPHAGPSMAARRSWAGADVRADEHQSGGGELNAGTWSAGPALRVARCCCGAAVDGVGRVWAVGGGEDMYRRIPICGSNPCIA